MFAFSVKNGFETLPLAEAMYGVAARVAQYDASKISVSPYAYLPRGRYTEYLWLYERCFDHNQLYEMIYEQVVSNSQAAAELYALLGLATGHVLAGHSVMNANSERSHEPLAPELMTYMRDHFTASNAELFDYLGYEVAEWR